MAVAKVISANHYSSTGLLVEVCRHKLQKRLSLVFRGSKGVLSHEVNNLTEVVLDAGEPVSVEGEQWLKEG